MITDHNLRDLQVLVLVKIMIILNKDITIVVNILIIIILTLMNILLRFWVLLPWSLYCTTPIRHITLMLNPLSQSSQPNGSHQQTYYYHYENYILGFYIVGMLMMIILCLVAIQCENDYILASCIYECILCNLLYYACIYFDMFLPTTHVFMLSLYILCAR